MKIEDIARVCHQVNKAYCEALGDFTQKNWGEAPEWQKESAVVGIRFQLANPEAPASASHESWFAQKVADGWKYGPFKDPVLRLHPCMVPFEDLPQTQQAKDHIFKGVVAALRPFLETVENAGSHGGRQGP